MVLNTSFADTYCPGTSRDTSAEEITALYRRLM